jgi:hypothetical protein
MRQCDGCGVVGTPTRGHISVAVLKEEAGVVALLGNDARNWSLAPLSRGPDHLDCRSELLDLHVLHLFELPFADPVTVVNDLVRQQPASLGSSQDGHGHALQLLHPNTHVGLSFLQGIDPKISKEGPQNCCSSLSIRHTGTKTSGCWTNMMPASFLIDSPPAVQTRSTAMCYVMWTRSHSGWVGINLCS